MRKALFVFLLLTASQSANAGWTNFSLTVRYQASDGNSDKSNAFCQFMEFMARKVCVVEAQENNATTVQLGTEDIRLHDYKFDPPDFFDATLHLEFADTALPASEQPQKERYRQVFTSICDSVVLPLHRKCQMSDIEVHISGKDGSRLVSYVADGLFSTKDGHFIPAKTP